MPKYPFRKIENFIKESMKKWKVPGLAMAVVKGDEIVYSKGFGYRDIRKKIPVDGETLFAIASCSKAFTTMSMAMLAEEKKLDWDKPVRDYLPDFKLSDPVLTERTTPRDLITHRTGLPRYDLLWYKSDFSREELYHRLAYLKPSKDIRTTYQYNNLLYMAAGYLVGKIANSSWEEFVQKRIFHPLDMECSNFTVEDSKRDKNAAQPYQMKNGKIKKIPFLNIDSVGPAGSINSSVHEMANWLKVHLNHGKFGKKKIISSEQLKEIHSPHMHVNEPIQYKELPYRNYGLGWAIRSYRGNLMIYHTGSIDGFTSLTSFLPDEKLGIVVLNNLDNSPLPFVITYTAYDYLLELKQLPWNQRYKKEKMDNQKKNKSDWRKIRKERKRGTKLSHSLKEYCGEYENPAFGKMLIEKKKNLLILTYSKFKFRMVHYHYDSFILRNPEFESPILASFETNTKGQIERISSQLESLAKPVEFTKK